MYGKYAQRKCIAQRLRMRLHGGIHTVVSDRGTTPCTPTHNSLHTHGGLHTQLLAHPEPFAGHTRVCGGYTRPFAEATRSSSRGLTLDYVNGIQARENHKPVNGMQLNGIRAGQMHNVNALHRRLYTRFAGATHNRLGATRTKTPVKKPKIFL